MGIFQEYIERRMPVSELVAERKSYLRKISEIRGGRNILVYASNFRVSDAANYIWQEDLLPLSDQLSNLSGPSLDVIIETPGGIGEVAEDMVRMIRHKFEDVAFIIPGSAKSAGTIMAMSGDDILMEPDSSLGPVDAQMSWQGRGFSAEAFKEGLEAIKTEVEGKGALNKAYIPILQNISPGEIQHAANAMEFAKNLVTQWLQNYKFRTWERHKSTGDPVTEETKRRRANEIAKELSNHSKWKTHGKSIKISDLREMGLRITDYSENTALYDAIRRYYVLLNVFFEISPQIYKVIETPTSQIYKRKSVEKEAANPKLADKAIIELSCEKCKNTSKIQLNFKTGIPLDEGVLAYPPNDIFNCPFCGAEHNLVAIRQNVELQTGRGRIK
ncbi:MAG: Clp protease ClpP [Nitrospinae bacterium]|nr:Clp protease ClpP [Nitrospinota bacterium]MBF0635198.1 Clp protease ClpP [Nitrospinota bacterium]